MVEEGGNDARGRLLKAIEERSGYPVLAYATVTITYTAEGVIVLSGIEHPPREEVKEDFPTVYEYARTLYEVFDEVVEECKTIASKRFGKTFVGGDSTDLGDGLVAALEEARVHRIASQPPPSPTL